MHIRSKDMYRSGRTKSNLNEERNELHWQVIIQCRPAVIVMSVGKALPNRPGEPVEVVPDVP
eukprot:11930868-Karenia_brevis.AAC.1